MKSFLNGRHLLVMCCVLTVVGGCFGSIGEPRRRFFTLQAKTLSQEAMAPVRKLGWVRVRDLDCEAAYDRTQIVERKSAYEITYRQADVWAVKPGRMVSDLLAHALGDAHIFDGVTRELGERRPDYLMAGDLRAVELILVPGGYHAHVAFDLTLARFSDSEVEWSFRFDETVPLSGHDINGAVQGLSDALSHGLLQALEGLAAHARTVGGTP